MSINLTNLIDLDGLRTFKELIDQSVDGKLSKLKVDLVQVVSALPEIGEAEEGVLYLVPAKASGEYDLYAKETVEGVAKFVKNSSLSISAYVQTGAVDQTVAGTKTFSEPIVGSVTGSSGSCTGNAATATKAVSADFATNASHATKAEQDGNGAVIADTYETKADAQAHADTAEATYQKAADITLAETADIDALFA